MSIRKKSAEIVPLASSTDANAVVAMIDKFLVNPDVPVEKLEQLFELHQRVCDQNNKTLFAAALNIAQSEMEPIAKDSNNPATRSKYASYDALDRAIRPIYTRHGFSISFNTGKSDYENHVKVIAYLTHASGYERLYEIDMPSDGKGARGNDVMTKTHALGSAVTYAKRYLLSSIFNVATTDKTFARDDDGNAAGAITEAPVAASSDATPKEIAEIKALMAQADAKVDKFFEYLDISDLSDLTKAKYAKAKYALGKKIQELEAQQKSLQTA